MKVFIAMDSFKGSLSSSDSSKAVTEGIQEVYPDVEVVTMRLADGGEGTVQALVEATGGRYVKTVVTGPLKEQVEAEYGILGGDRIAVIEVAAACGLPLVPEGGRNPLLTTTYGVGELILDAVQQGCREFIIGLGGSATNDAGAGMLQALGYRFLDQGGKEVTMGGYGLQNIRSIDVSNANPVLQECTFRIACDVDNPLYGPEGAAYVFGPQKGATPEMIKILDNGLQSFAQAALYELEINLQKIPGAGAAGGLGAAFAGFLKGQMQSGVELVLELTQMEEKMRGAEWVITGEGKLDGQTSRGKAPLGVAKLASQSSIPVIALAGGVTPEAKELNAHGVAAYFSIVTRPMSLDEAMNLDTAYDNLRTTVSQLFRLVKASRG